MACGLNKGRIEPCKDVVGGIKAVYFIDYGDITIAYDSVDTDSVEDLGTVTAYKYELKGNSSFEQTINASRENGTTFFEQNLNLTLKKLSVADHKEIKFLAYGRPHIVVHDYNGNAFLMGAEHGSDCNGGTIVTGAAMGDLSGYTLSFSASEQIPANFLEGATEADPFAGMSSTVTVTSGSDF
jgi:hypothetical protein|tara:strand:- start:5219 stop:5767 length:549 start_codon:yes stop_codon:yes gene_type:complete